MLSKFIRTSVILILLVGPAAAQIGSTTPDSRLSVPLNMKAPKTPEEIEKQKAADRAYEAAIKKIPDKKPSADPWGNIRPAASSASKASNNK